MEIRGAQRPVAPLKQLAAGRVDLAISYEPEVLRARDQGLHVVAVGALVQRPLTSIISLAKAGITRRAKDLAGKTVGTAGIDYQSGLPPDDPGGHGVNPSKVKERNVGFDLVPALVTGRVDAILGGFWNYEGVQLQLEKRHAAHHPRGPGRACPTYDELVLVANSDALEREAATIRALHRRPLAGVRDLKARSERAPSTGLLKANRDLDPGPPARVAEGHAAAVLAASGQALRLAGPRRVERVRRLDERERDPQRLERRGGLHEPVPARAGPVGKNPRGCRV